MLSRTAGAPSLPIKSEQDLLWEQAVQQHAAGEITDDHLLAVARATGRSAQVRAEIAQKFDAANARSAANMPAERAASRAAAAPPEPDMTSVDTLPGDEPGTQRVWNPRSGQYDTVPKRGIRQTVAPEPDPRIGSRWGGGRPFSSTAERDEYYNRPTLTPAQRQAMIDAGASPEEIADAEASQADKDARQAGMGTHGGYAPVFINGRVHMLPRAPTPGPVALNDNGKPIRGGDDEYVYENLSDEGGAPMRQPSSSDTSALLDFGRGLSRGSVSEQQPVPIGSDGRPVVGGWSPGTANAATGNASAGTMAANRDVPPGLRRPDLEARGFKAMFMEGPNGGEWVYRMPETERNAAIAKSNADRARRTTSRLRVKAGVVGNAQYDGADDNQLRELIAANREAQREQNETMWRARAMVRGGNAVGAQALPGLNDWQRQMLAGGPTPLAVDAVGAQNAMRMMNAEALAGMDPRRTQMQQEAREAQIDALPPEQQTAISIRRGEEMGTGRSAGHVQARWNYWMNNFGPRPVQWREDNFRQEMEGLGYKPAQIDAWIDARRARAAAADAPGPAAPPVPPFGALPGDAAF